MSKEIKINDRFSIEHDPRCWVLHEYRPGISSKTGDPIRTKHDTYWANLSQVAREIVHQMEGEADNLLELFDLLKQAHESVYDFLSLKATEAGHDKK